MALVRNSRNNTRYLYYSGTVEDSSVSSSFLSKLYSTCTQCISGPCSPASRPEAGTGRANVGTPVAPRDWCTLCYGVHVGT